MKSKTNKKRIDIIEMLILRLQIIETELEIQKLMLEEILDKIPQPKNYVLEKIFRDAWVLPERK